MRRRLLAAAVTALLSGHVVGPTAANAAAAAESGTPVMGRFPSPDGRLVAVITRGHDRRPGGAEVEIETTAGPPLLRKDYASGRSDDRLDIVQFQWTPDSAFFVFSVTNADGHQPWHFPVLFYSRAANAIQRLEDFSDGLSIVDPAFKVFAPDIVEVVGQKRIDRPSETRRFRLSGLSAARRAAPPPASGDDLNAGRK